MAGFGVGSEYEDIGEDPPADGYFVEPMTSARTLISGWTGHIDLIDPLFRPATACRRADQAQGLGLLSDLARIQTARLRELDVTGDNSGSTGSITRQAITRRGAARRPGRGAVESRAFWRTPSKAGHRSRINVPITYPRTDQWLHGTGMDTP